jgi:hypothetical protein
MLSAGHHKPVGRLAECFGKSTSCGNTSAQMEQSFWIQSGLLVRFRSVRFLSIPNCSFPCLSSPQVF